MIDRLVTLRVTILNIIKTKVNCRRMEGENNSRAERQTGVDFTKLFGSKFTASFYKLDLWRALRENTYQRPI